MKTGSAVLLRMLLGGAEMAASANGYGVGVHCCHDTSYCNAGGRLGPGFVAASVLCGLLPSIAAWL